MVIRWWPRHFKPIYAILVTLVTFFRGGQGPGHLFILVSFILVFHLFHFKPSPTLNLYMRVQLKYNFELFITNWEKIVHIGFYLWDFNIMHWKWPPMCTLIIFSLKVMVLNKTNNIVHINHSSPVNISGRNKSARSINVTCKDKNISGIKIEKIIIPTFTDVNISGRYKSERSINVICKDKNLSGTIEKIFILICTDMNNENRITLKG